MNNQDIPKAYDPKETESHVYQTWLDSGSFNPDNLPEGKAFTVIMPPPNVTGTLHMGHAFEDTVQDAFIRFKRMQGFKTLWLPGTDSAAIATQAKVETELYKKEGKTRHDFSREEFVKIINDFALESQQTILSQIKRMGASCDWSRLAYTLDDKRILAVNTAFKHMYEEGLIYRGNRLVNWDPKLQTNVSDDEIEWKEEVTPFYYLKYGPFVIGTARPETKFGDKYVVMHPEDVRYKEYKHGQIIEVEWINGPITATIIKDESIDMEFGTGVMTITPAHDTTDYDIAKRHGLDIEQIIDLKGLLLPIAGGFAGQHIKKARPLIIEKLQSKGLVGRIDDKYVHRIATNSRGGGIIEPQIREQWFIDVNRPFKFKGDQIKGIKDGELVSLKVVMRHVIESGQIQIFPDHFKKIYFHWIDNLKDWCISRQILFGHQIPVWYKGEDIYCDIKAPQDTGWQRDSDTLDTWFSSGLWTFSTLGWPENTNDLEYFHPTSIIIPGYEILFFWVARMILMSTYLLGQPPFQQVLLHGMVRDKQGRKFSKSLNNGIDPLDMIEKYGTDALRMALTFGSAPGNDIAFDEQKVKGMKHFANKIWNISRFIMMNGLSFSDLPEAKSDADTMILNKLNSTIKDATKFIEGFQLHEAAQLIYDFIWHEFADIYLEASKPQLQNDELKQNTQNILLHTLSNSLKLLHPFMPFVTEHIWKNLRSNNLIPDKELLITSNWPNA